MTDSYTKLFSSITESTIWSEPAGTRLVWITMLAKCNRHGEVFGSVPGLARLANVSLEECKAAIETLMAPDPWSRTPDHEGRRIEAIDGGWLLLNHAKFDRMRSEAEAADQRRDRQRLWDQEHRPSGHARSSRGKKVRRSPTQSDESPTQSVPPPTPTPTESTTPEFLTHTESHLSARASTMDGGAIVEPTVAGRACRLMREAGCVSTNPHHVDLLAALAEGVTPDALAETVREALARSPPIAKPFAWAVATARGRHAAGPSEFPGVPRGTDQPRESLVDRNARRAAEILGRAAVGEPPCTGHAGPPLARSAGGLGAQMDLDAR